MGYLVQNARRGAARATDTTLWITVVAGSCAGRVAGAAIRRSRSRGERGDVPGWVLVTLMTAGLVTALWVLAKNRLTQVFDTAISSVTGP